MDSGLGLRAFVLAGRFPPADQAGAMQVRVFRRAQSGSGRIVRPGPARTVVVKVPKHVEVLLPAGWTGIEGLAA